jgi:hypothetical protein
VVFPFEQPEYQGMLIELSDQIHRSTLFVSIGRTLSGAAAEEFRDSAVKIGTAEFEPKLYHLVHRGADEAQHQVHQDQTDGHIQRSQTQHEELPSIVR